MKFIALRLVTLPKMVHQRKEVLLATDPVWYLFALVNDNNVVSLWSVLRKTWAADKHFGECQYDTVTCS
jgi:hypothetical protein